MIENELLKIIDISALQNENALKNSYTTMYIELTPLNYTLKNA